jgi:hypothetical protein
MIRTSCLSIGLAALAVVGAPQARASDWDIVLNGHAVHVNAEKHWNERNWGLGVEKEFQPSSRWVKLAVANGFEDSLDHPSFMAGGGVKRRFRMFSSDGLYFDIGVVGFVMTRQDVDHGQPFPGALPTLTFGAKRLAVNVTYMPDAVVDRMTHANLRDPAMKGVFFVQLKLDASLFGPHRSRPAFADARE